MGQFIFAAKVTDIPDQRAKCVDVKGQRIALFNLGGEFYGIDDERTHEGGPLSEGLIHGDEVECPWHSAHFKISPVK